MFTCYRLTNKKKKKKKKKRKKKEEEKKWKKKEKKKMKTAFDVEHNFYSARVPGANSGLRHSSFLPSDEGAGKRCWERVPGADPTPGDSQTPRTNLLTTDLSRIPSVSRRKTRVDAWPPRGFGDD